MSIHFLRQPYFMPYNKQCFIRKQKINLLIVLIEFTKEKLFKKVYTIKNWGMILTNLCLYLEKGSDYKSKPYFLPPTL